MKYERHQKTQLDRFKEAACQLETDDDEAKFNDKLVKPRPKGAETSDD